MAKETLPPGDPRHGASEPGGFPNGYVNYRCRCHLCREAQAEFTRAKRRDRHARMVAGEAHPEHGKNNTYVNWLCRCYACTRAHQEVMSRYRRGGKTSS